MKTLAFCGFAGSGKNTAAEHALHVSSQTGTPAVSLAFADALKDAVATIFRWDRHLLNGDTDASRLWREQVDPVWSARLGRPLTPRRILQEIGTDVFRAHFHPDIWLAAVEARLHENTLHVITDARFGNELRWIRNHAGAVVWVYRPLSTLDAILTHEVIIHAPRLHENMFDAVQHNTTLHSSEYSFLTEGASNIHVVLMNTGTRDALERLTYHVMQVAHNPSRYPLPWNATTLYLSIADTSTQTFDWRYTIDTTYRHVYCSADATLWYNDTHEEVTHV